MIKTLIFDFGDVFINLNKEATEIELNKLGINSFSEEMQDINLAYEIGEISTSEFSEFYLKKFPNFTEEQLHHSWNAIILDLPDYRLQFIEYLAENKKYNLFLLSNTNELHIEKVIENISALKYHRFKKCFKEFYLSHEINLRKPSAEIFEYVLKKNGLLPSECLFIDDTLEHTETAEKLGIHTWHIKPEVEDVVDLFTIKKDLF